MAPSSPSAVSCLWRHKNFIYNKTIHSEIFTCTKLFSHGTKSRLLRSDFHVPAITNFSVKKSYFSSHQGEHRASIKLDRQQEWVLSAEHGSEAGAWMDESTALLDNVIPDAIMVLAGGQTSDGGVPVWVQRRLDASLRIHLLHGATCPVVCLGGGTPHRPPVVSPNTGHVIHEGTSCANYLLEKGLSPEMIIKEWGSYDTIANGFFALVWHAIPGQWRNIVVVTSDFHMPRSKMIFKWIFGLKGAHEWMQASLDPQSHSVSCPPAEEYGGSADDSSHGLTFVPTAMANLHRSSYNLQFISVSDEGIGHQLIQARKEKEAQGIALLKGHMGRIQTLKEFHRWFHTGHKAYNVADQNDFGNSSLPDPSELCY